MTSARLATDNGMEDAGAVALAELMEPHLCAESKWTYNDGLRKLDLSGRHCVTHLKIWIVPISCPVPRDVYTVSDLLGLPYVHIQTMPLATWVLRRLPVHCDLDKPVMGPGFAMNRCGSFGWEVSFMSHVQGINL